MSDDASACCHKLAVNFNILSWDTEQNTDPCTHFLSFYERYYTSRRRSQKVRMFSLPLPFCALSVVHAELMDKVKNCQPVYKTQAGNRNVHKCAHMHAFTQSVRTRSVGLMPEWSPWCRSERLGESESKTSAHTHTNAHTVGGISCNA